MSLHLTQVAHPVFNPGGDRSSQNCGPTSLAMALRSLDLPIPALPSSPEDGGRRPWLTPAASVQQQIDAVRYAMFSDATGRSIQLQKDGVEFTRSGPRRVWEKHQTLVNWDDLLRGAENCGAKGVPVSRFRQLHRALSCRAVVLLAGDPGAAGAPGARLGVSYQGGHVVLLVGYKEGYVIHDPLCLSGQARVSPAELRAFCGARVLGDQIGLALFRRFPGFAGQAVNEAR